MNPNTIPRHELTGRIVRFADGYYAVETDGPAHLALLYLAPFQTAGAAVGERVRLTYRTSPSSGLWFVTDRWPAQESAEALEATREALWQAVRAAGEALDPFPKGPLGLTPDAVKASPEWQAAKRRSREAFAALRAFNAAHPRRRHR